MNPLLRLWPTFVGAFAYIMAWLAWTLIALADSSAKRMRKAGISCRVGQLTCRDWPRYARNDELGIPFGVTVDFACMNLPLCELAAELTYNKCTAVKNGTLHPSVKPRLLLACCTLTYFL